MKLLGMEEHYQKWSETQDVGISDITVNSTTLG